MSCNHQWLLGCPSTLEMTSLSSCPLLPDTEIWGLIFAYLGFSLGLVMFYSVALFFSLLWDYIILYFIFNFISFIQGFPVKTLPWVSEETLAWNFESL